MRKEPAANQNILKPTRKRTLTILGFSLPCVFALVLMVGSMTPAEAYRYGVGYSSAYGHSGYGNSYSYGHSSPYGYGYNRGGYSNSYSYPYLYNRPYTISQNHLYHTEHNYPGRFGMPPVTRYYNALPPGVSPRSTYRSR